MNNSNSATVDQFTLPHIDKRTREARLFRGILAGLTEQLGHAPSSAEIALLRAAAVFQTLVEMDTQALLKGEDVAAEKIRRNFTALRAALTALGMAKKSRDISGKDYVSGQSVLSQTASLKCPKVVHISGEISRLM